MDAQQAYSLLADELEVWRSLGYRELVARVGAEPLSTTTQTGADLVTTEMRVTWEDKTIGNLLVGSNKQSYRTKNRFACVS
jgi:hypothetical protein